VRQLHACRAAWGDRFEVVFGSPSDEDCPDDLDIVDYIERCTAELGGALQGVTSSSDYPGAVVAAAIATALHLPGSRPEDVLACSHKWYARQLQRAAVPDATPWFELVDPRRPRNAALRFPCFVKPVKGAFSVLARRVDCANDLETHLDRPAVHDFTQRYLKIFDQLVHRYTDFEFDGGWFLAEGLLRGHQVTVEGFSCGGDVEILGIVDSIMHPDTSSFARFDYPSCLEPPVQARMRDLVRRAVTALHLDNTLFNVEMLYDACTGAIHIIEVNPRLCGQFADLYEKVDGTNGYEVALALACGERPSLKRRRGRFRRASSFPLRVFEPVRVVRAPDAAHLRAVESEFPGTLVWSECATGQQLADFEDQEDGHSCRYAIVNTGADDARELLERAATIEARLDFEFAPL
jgi:biotin carboxylase